MLNKHANRLCLCSKQDMSLVIIKNYIDNSTDSLMRKLKDLIKKSFLAFLYKQKISLGRYFGRRIAEHQKVFESEIIFNKKKIVRCPNCQLTWLHPMPSSQDLTNYYDKAFWDNKNAKFVISAVNPNEKNRAYYQYEFMANYINFPQQINDVLEFGAGHAGISYFINNIHPKISISVVEPDDAFCNAHSRLGVCKEVLKELSEVKQTYDLVTSSHSLEHVSNIIDTMEAMAKIVRPNGYLFLEVPNANEIYFKYYKNDKPHTYFFNMETICNIAASFQFKILDIGEFGPNKKEFMDNNSFTIEELRNNVRKENGGNLRCLLQKKV